MGKGDIKTKKGKTFNGSFGIKRPRKPRKGIKLREFELIIIESLKSSEKQTGKILNDEIIKFKKFQEPNLSSTLIEVCSKIEFISCLKRIRKRITIEGLFPILHFETHGSEDGLHLSNGDIFTWEEIFEETRAINIVLKNSLMLNLGMCEGISLIAKIDPMKRAPFRAIVGTSSDISWSKLLEGFEIYYTNFFFTFSGVRSVSEVNKVLNKEGFSFNYLKSEEFIDKFIDKNRDPRFTKHLINDLAVTEKATNPLFKDVDFKDVIKYSEEKMDYFINEVVNYRDKFLMKDIKRFSQKTKQQNKTQKMPNR